MDGIIAGNGASYAANADNSESKIKLGLVLVKVSLFLLLGMFLGFVVSIRLSKGLCQSSTHLMLFSGLHHDNILTLGRPLLFFSTDDVLRLVSSTTNARSSFTKCMHPAS